MPEQSIPEEPGESSLPQQPESAAQEPDAVPQQADPSHQATPAPRAGWRRWLSRRNVIILGLLAAGVSLLGVTRTWMTVPPPQSNVQLEPLTVSGHDAAGAVLALSIVAVAAALAGTIAARIARPIVAAVQALVGVGIVAFTVTTLRDPVTAAAGAVSTRFGVERVHGVHYAVTAWPWLCVVGGVLVVLAALLLLFTGRGSTSHRYERTRGGRAVVTAATMDDIDRWDAFTEGEDPTDGEGEGGRPGARYH